jgi:hypothetical protein
MKKMGIGIALVLAAMTVGAAEVVKDGVTNQAVVVLGPVGEPAKSVTAILDLPVFTEFNSRGRRFQDETVFQPNVTVNKLVGNGTAFVNTWGNMAPDTYSDKGEQTFNEVDITVGYQNTYKKIAYGVGLIEYVYSGQDIPSTHEAYATTTFLYPLSPMVAIYYDFKEANGFYGIASVSHTANINERWSVTADTGVGYADADYNNLYFGVDKDALNDWNSGVTLSVKTTKNVTLSTSARYVDMLDGDIENGAIATYGSEDSIIAKIALTANF